MERCLRDSVAVSGHSLVATSGQNSLAAHTAARNAYGDIIGITITAA